MAEQFPNVKRIVCIAPVFFDYHRSVAEALEAKGWTVNLFPEKPNPYLLKPLKMLSKRWALRLQEAHLRKILRATRDHTCEQLFVIRGEILTPAFMTAFKAQHPGCRSTLYQWDSLRNNPYAQLIDSFDQVYTFDSQDARNDSRIHYLPLFYGKEYETLRKLRDPQIDCTFIGTYTPERLALLATIRQQLLQQGLSHELFLYCQPLTYLKARLQGKKLPGVSIRPLNRQQVLQRLGNARCVLDMPHPQQSGLTMRTFETLGAHRKLVTTNTHIVGEPFFTPETIQVLNSAGTIDPIFLRTATDNFPDVLEAYALENWLDQLIPEA
jgi:hypothetical protein